MRPVFFSAPTPTPPTPTPTPTPEPTPTPPPGGAPAAPTGLSANQNNNDIVLNWNDNTEPDLAGYNVYNSTTSGGTKVKLNSSLVTVSAYTHVGGCGYYVVTAVNTSAQESGYSNQVYMQCQN